LGEHKHSDHSSYKGKGPDKVLENIAYEKVGLTWVLPELHENFFWKVFKILDKSIFGNTLKISMPRNILTGSVSIILT
jgi:hypothetical protein